MGFIEMKPFFSLLWEIFKIFIIALAIIIPIRYFLAQPFFVNGASMEPNFENGEYLIVDEASYYLRTPERGEVVVFRYPLDTKEFFIKRIIGLPNETLEIHGSKITIFNQANPQGFVLDESSYLKIVPSLGDEKIILQSDQYFVLGDNRAASYDSRRWGAVPRNDLIGRAWLRIWPFNRARAFEAPTY